MIIMSEYGAALQTFNQELVKCIEDLKRKRIEIQVAIEREEDEKRTLEKRVKVVLDELNVVNKSLEKHIEMRDNYDQAIHESESGFKKILESSQMLLNLAQHEASRLEDNIKSEKNDHIKNNAFTANF